MRRFPADYLADTRRGMWEDRGALADLDLPGRERILDVGCGTGALTAVLREESDARVVGLDADPGLLRRVDGDRALGDALRLPFRDGAFDLAVCQALLVNLPDPAAAVRELARVSSDLVAAIEPDNAAVSVESTVEAEAPLARRAREAYIAGVDTDVTLGAGAADLLRDAGLQGVSTRPYRHRRTVAPPYSDRAVEGAARKASGSRLADQRETLLAGDLDAEGYEALRAEWRAMGREAVEQMRAGEYEREEVVPFYLSVGRHPSDGSEPQA